MTYKVEIIEILTGEVVSIIGTELTRERADKRVLTGLTRIDRAKFFVRSSEEND